MARRDGVRSSGKSLGVRVVSCSDATSQLWRRGWLPTSLDCWQPKIRACGCGAFPPVGMRCNQASEYRGLMSCSRELVCVSTLVNHAVPRARQSIGAIRSTFITPGRSAASKRRHKPAPQLALFARLAEAQHSSCTHCSCRLATTPAAKSTPPRRNHSAAAEQRDRLTLQQP